VTEPRTATGRKFVSIYGLGFLDDVLGIEAEAVGEVLRAGEYLRMAGQAYWEESDAESRRDFEAMAIEWDELVDPMRNIGLNAEELDPSAPWNDTSGR
jgi:hypothetical protein